MGKYTRVTQVRNADARKDNTVKNIDYLLHFREGEEIDLEHGPFDKEDGTALGTLVMYGGGKPFADGAERDHFFGKIEEMGAADFHSAIERNRFVGIHVYDVEDEGLVTSYGHGGAYKALSPVGAVVVTHPMALEWHSGANNEISSSTYLNAVKGQLTRELQMHNNWLRGMAYRYEIEDLDDNGDPTGHALEEAGHYFIMRDMLDDAFAALRDMIFDDFPSPHAIEVRVCDTEREREERAATQSTPAIETGESNIPSVIELVTSAKKGLSFQKEHMVVYPYGHHPVIIPYKGERPTWLATFTDDGGRLNIETVGKLTAYSGDQELLLHIAIPDVKDIWSVIETLDTIAKVQRHA